MDQTLAADLLGFPLWHNEFKVVKIRSIRMVWPVHVTYFVVDGRHISLLFCLKMFLKFINQAMWDTLQHRLSNDDNVVKVDLHFPSLPPHHTDTQTRPKMCLISMTCFTCKIRIVGAVSRWMILLHRYHPVRFVAKKKGANEPRACAHDCVRVCVCGKHRARVREMIIVWPFHLWLGDLGTIFNLAHLPTVS